jgi:release factor glutamine methyltransferase
MLLLISSLTGLAEVQDLFSRQGFSADIAMQQTVEDEELYVLRIVRS